MDKRSFIKTSLGSLAALALPVGASDISSNFAPGQSFKLGEITLLIHDDAKRILSVIHRIANSVSAQTHIVCFQSGFFSRKRLNYIRKNMKLGQLLMVEDLKKEDLAVLKEFSQENPGISIVCGFDIKNGEWGSSADRIVHVC